MLILTCWITDAALERAARMFGYSHKYSQGVKDKHIVNMLYPVALSLKVLYYTVCDSGSVRNEELFPSSKLLLKWRVALATANVTEY